MLLCSDFLSYCIPHMYALIQKSHKFMFTYLLLELVFSLVSWQCISASILNNVLIQEGTKPLVILKIKYLYSILRE